MKAKIKKLEMQLHFHTEMGNKGMTAILKKRIEKLKNQIR